MKFYRHQIVARLLPMAGLILALALVFGGATPQVAQADPGVVKDPLLGHDRELLDQAVADGEKSVTVLIAAVAGSEAAVAQQIAQLGGTVQVSDTDVGYIRAVVPTAQAETVAKLKGVQALDLDEVIELDDPRPDGIQPPTPQPPPDANTPNNNPYMPIGDTGASQFMAAHPTWDGRGVSVGVLDTGIDLDHPSLKTTTTGERKIIDWVTFTDPIGDNDPTWVNMQDSVRGSRFTYNGITYRAPANITFRIGLFNERDPRLGGELGSDVNRDGNPAGSNGIFAVLWDQASNNVWVDTNQNNSFADELALTDYRVYFDVGTFGVDNPATPIREAMPFVVQTDKKNNYVNIGIVSGAHGTHVAGIIAAHRMFGGQMSGAAPGAKLVSVRVCLFIAGCTAHALTEGMIWVAKTAKVNVINMSIGGLPALNDGNNARAELYNRLIEKYKVQMYISAGNSGPGINTIGDPSLVTDVMSIGSYISKATWQFNYGSSSSYTDNLHNYTSLGPREDGGFKPQVVAPGAAISTIPTWQPGGPVPGVFTLPPGYAMFNGTSMASPQAAGVGALLVSAAKQENISWKPDQIRTALNSSARLLDTTRMPVYAQGNGLINVAAAWEILKSNVKTVKISSQVPVSTVLSSFLKIPGIGVGIYDREGVEVGSSYVRQYKFVRTNGPARPVTYNLRWVGNDGTFSSPATLVLPLNVTTTLDVKITPASAGAHAAILNLDDPRSAGIEYQTMNVVIAPKDFSADSNHTITYSGTVGRNQTVRYFFRILEGTPAFKVTLTGTTGQVRFLRFHPYGVSVDSTASTSCYIPPSGTCSTGDPASRTVVNPFPGVWEVTVDARRTSDADPAAYTLTASVLGAEIDPNPDIIPSVPLNVTQTRAYTITNTHGTFTGNALGSMLLSSAHEDRPTISNHDVQTYTVSADTGASSLTIKIGNPSDPGADLDLYVYDTSGALVGQGTGSSSEEVVNVLSPSGTYTVIVDAYAVPAGSTEYDYRDAITHSKYGSFTISDPSASHPGGSSWTVTGQLKVTSAPETGRFLLGQVVVKGDGATVATGDVRVLGVTP